jgi:hypothetical protein
MPNTSVPPGWSLDDMFTSMISIHVSHLRNMTLTIDEVAKMTDTVHVAWSSLVLFVGFRVSGHEIPSVNLC